MNKTIIITGASSGIGEAAARQLAMAGARLCLVARRADELERVQREIEAGGGKVWVYPCDLTDAKARAACCKAILTEHERIDVLVNNAGRSIRRRITDSLDRLHDYQRTMEINYFAAVDLTLQLLPRFLEQGHGHIINVSTLSTMVPVPFFSAYVSSKLALEGFSRSLLAELSDKGIEVTVIHFPLVKTPMTAPTAVYRKVRQVSPDQAGGWIVRAIRKKPARMASMMGQGVAMATSALPGFMARGTGRALRYASKKLRQQLADEG